jgi:Ca-activated chloride channel family protein
MPIRDSLATLIFLFLVAVLCAACGTLPGPMMAAPAVPKEMLLIPINYDALDEEEYNRIYENPFLDVIKYPLSTLSVDVDTASYSNVRRMINQGKLPPKNAVRIEELINYFSYDYPEPDEMHPFSVTTEVSVCPWNEAHKLVRIGLKGKTIPLETLPPSNLVFLIDVSGSMSNRLPLVKSALKLLVEQMRRQDRIAIVVYAGAAGLVLPSTSGDQKAGIINTLDSLETGGSTAGGAGINLAYQVALENRLESGNNRVILATDGDFNVGPSTQSDLYELIEQKRNQGVFLTLLGFGMGNIKDAAMELLADKGNGNYAYIDSLFEAKKVLVTEMGATLLTIAKDVKIKTEFNPTKVKSYRLIGYENRLLRNEDFTDDTKDAGEIGAGHVVTIFYETMPASAEHTDQKSSLKYTETTVKKSAYQVNEIMTVKLRYKHPNEFESKLIVHPIIDKDVFLANASEDFKFASSVAEFGLLLRNSQYKADASYEAVITRARHSRGQDLEGYRSEFIRLAEAAKSLNTNRK